MKSQLIIASLFALLLLALCAGIASAQKRTSAGSARVKRVAALSARSKIDRAKPTRHCDGHFIQGHRLKNDPGSVVMDENFLKGLYDFADIKRKALSRRYKIVDDRPFVPILNLSLVAFNYDFNTGTPVKAGDAPRQIGSLQVKLISQTDIEINGPKLEVSKTTARGEEFYIAITYAALGRDNYPQYVSVSQKGRCNLRDSYLRAKAKELLAELGIESDWVDATEVSVNTID